jgi:hypothetical protein
VYWSVPDAQAAFEAMAPKTEVVVPLKQMPFGQVFGIEAPADETRYLIEFSKNRPSQPAR